MVSVRGRGMDPGYKGRRSLGVGHEPCGATVRSTVRRATVRYMPAWDKEELEACW